ncbi:MAG TPA: hypothetical protein V6C96_02965, partial [Vampirovibrionales bacterium]
LFSSSLLFTPALSKDDLSDISLDNPIEADYLPYDEVLLKGSATNVLREDAPLTISMMSLLSSELNVEGDPVSAKILVKPGNENDALQALKGSLITGKVIEVKPSRKAGRAGYVKVAFDTLTIPSGKEFPIYAEMKSESFKGKEAGKMILYDAKLLTLGALMGTYNSLKWAPVAAVATQGVSVAVSAGIGMSFGLIGALRRKGEERSFFPGEREVIELKSPLSLSDEVLQEAALANKQLESKLLGLKMELLETTYMPSEDYEHLLSLKVKLNNDSGSYIYPCDLLLVPKDGGDPVLADLRTSGFDLLKKIPDGKSSVINIQYPITSSYSPADYHLALIDPLDKVQLSKIAIYPSKTLKQ